MYVVPVCMIYDIDEQSRFWGKSQSLMFFYPITPGNINIQII